MDMKLEAVVIGVSDVDRAKRFYKGLGWREDADFLVDEGFRAVQLTPPGSPCSIQFGLGLSPARAGSVALFLAVRDVEAARAELIAHGADVSEVFTTRAAASRCARTPRRTHPGPTRSAAATRPTPPSPTPTATGTSCRSSRRACPAGELPDPTG